MRTRVAVSAELRARAIQLRFVAQRSTLSRIDFYTQILASHWVESERRGVLKRTGA